MKVAAVAGAVRVAAVPIVIVCAHVIAGKTDRLAVGNIRSGRNAAASGSAAGVGWMAGIGSVIGTGRTAETDSGRAGMKQDNAAVIALTNGDPDMPARTHDVSGMISGYLAARDKGSEAAGSKFCRHPACGHDIAAGYGTADRRTGCMKKIINTPAYIAGAVEAVVDLIAGGAVVIGSSLFLSKLLPARTDAEGTGFPAGTGIGFVPAAAPHVHDRADRQESGLKKKF